MKKVLLVLVAVLSVTLTSNLFAQEPEALQDVVYLKNGIVYVGEILKDENSYVAIRTHQGINEIHKNNIEKISKELRPILKAEEPKPQKNNQTTNNQATNNQITNNHSYTFLERIPYRNAGIATLMSIFIPGGGQFYNEEVGKGIAFFLWGTASNTSLIYNLYSTSKDKELYLIVSGISSLICTIVGIIDANISAEIINRNRLASINLGDNKYLSFSPDYRVLNINNKSNQVIGLNASISF